MLSKDSGPFLSALPTALARLCSWQVGNAGVAESLPTLTPVPESGTRRDPVELAVGHAVFTNLMACFRCDSCEALSIRSLWTGDLVEPELSPAGIAAILTAESPLPFADPRWYPQGTHGKRYPDVPADIGALASEAHKCLAVEGYRGAVLLARSVIEAAAKDKDITTDSLVAKIDAMYEARLIREDVRDGAHEVRYLGNDVAHGDFAEPVPPADEELVLTLMDEVLEEVYQSPARVARRRAARLDKRTTRLAGPGWSPVS